MKEKKWAGDLSAARKEVIRFCPKCSKQAYHIVLNRHCVALFAECMLCGYKR